MTITAEEARSKAREIVSKPDFDGVIVETSVSGDNVLTDVSLVNVNPVELVGALNAVYVSAINRLEQSPDSEVRETFYRMIKHVLDRNAPALESARQHPESSDES